MWEDEGLSFAEEMELRPPVTLKVVVLGDSRVGKSQIINQIVHKSFRKDYFQTDGVRLADHQVKIHKKNVEVEIWENAGHRRNIFMYENFYQQNTGAFLVYDITNRQSFDSIPYWLEQFQINANKKTDAVLIGNKSDLESTRQVTFEEATEFAEKHNLAFYEASAKEATRLNSYLFFLLANLQVKEASAAEKQILEKFLLSKFKENFGDLPLIPDVKYKFKVVVVGNSTVGKTQIINRYVNNFYEDGPPVNATECQKRTIDIERYSVEVQIWDCNAGGRLYKDNIDAYYQGAHGVILVYDITDKKSFTDLQQWMEEVKKHTDEKVKMMLLGNKCDLNDKREVQMREAIAFAVENRLDFYEISAFAATDVRTAFYALLKEIYDRKEKEGALDILESLGSYSNYIENEISISDRYKHSLAHTNKEVYHFKLVVEGNSGVGKTQILNRFVNDTFVHESQCRDIIELKKHTVYIKEHKVVVQTWDHAANGELYKKLINEYYEGTDGAILVYDIADRKSFTDIVQWLRDSRSHDARSIIAMLLGNKIDLQEQRSVTAKEAREFAENQGLIFFETSALEPADVVLAFHSLLTEICDREQQKKEVTIK